MGGRKQAYFHYCPSKGKSRRTYAPDVSGNSPAEKAGVKAGGIIVSVDGNTVENYEDFDKLLGAIEPYADLVLGVDYGGETKCFTLQKQKN